MGKLFRKSLFGGFHKKDVIAYLENSAEQHKNLKQMHAQELQEQNQQAEALQQMLREAEAQMQELRQQIVQAEDHAAALRREADNAENRGAEARVRANELEKKLAQVQLQVEELHAAEQQIQEQLEVIPALAEEKVALEARCQELQAELTLCQQALEDQAETLACRQAEYDKLQAAYNDLLQQRQAPQRMAVQEPRTEELLYLRREIERMRDSYDVLMRQMLGYNWQREPVKTNPIDYRDLLDKMDRALDCLEQLVACRECRAEAPASNGAVEVGEPAEPEKKEVVKKTLALEEILRLVRSKK